MLLRKAKRAPEQHNKGRSIDIDAQSCAQGVLEGGGVVGRMFHQAGRAIAYLWVSEVSAGDFW